MGLQICMFLLLWALSYVENKSPSDEDLAPCFEMCDTTYPLHTYPKVRSLDLCKKGCRLNVAIQQLYDDYDADSVQELCCLACNKSHSNMLDIYACSMGCNNQPELKKQKDADGMDKIPLKEPEAFMIEKMEAVVIPKVKEINDSAFLPKERGFRLFFLGVKESSAEDKDYTFSTVVAGSLIFVFLNLCMVVGLHDHIMYVRSTKVYMRDAFKRIRDLKAVIASYDAAGLVPKSTSKKQKQKEATVVQATTVN